MAKLLKGIGTKVVTDSLLNCSLIICFYITFWICNTTTEHILSFDSWAAIGLSLFNLVFFSSFFFFLIRMFNGVGSPFDSKSSVDDIFSFIKRFHIKEICILLSIQMFFDVLRWFLLEYAKEYAFFALNPLSAVKWILFYFVLQKNSSVHLFQQRKMNILAIFLFVIALIIGVVLNLLDLSEYNFWAEKLASGSAEMKRLVLNYNYHQTIIHLFLECGFSLILYVFHMILNKPKKSIASWKNVLFLVPLRVGIIVTLCCFILAFKFFVVPRNSLSHSGNRYTSNLFFTAKKRFDLDWSTLYHTKRIDYTSADEPVCEDITIRVCYQKDLKLKCLAEISHYQEIPMASPLYEENLNILDKNVWILQNCVICYEDDDQPIAILFRDINNQPKNEVLVETCKEMIKVGNVAVFDYAAEYLQRYDSNFIRPYINCYAMGEFTTDEEKYIAELSYRPEYLSSLAKDLQKIGNGSVS